MHLRPINAEETRHAKAASDSASKRFIFLLLPSQVFDRAEIFCSVQTSPSRMENLNTYIYYINNNNNNNNNTNSKNLLSVLDTVDKSIISVSFRVSSFKAPPLSPRFVAPPLLFSFSPFVASLPATESTVVVSAFDVLTVVVVVVVVVVDDDDVDPDVVLTSPRSSS